MYHIVICDDEPSSLKRLSGYLDRFGAETERDFERTLFSSGDQLLQDYPANTDILLLDIAMSGINGMEAARRIRATDENVCIIFITSMQQYALEGYSVRAFGFVKKPVSYPQFRHEITAAVKAIDSLRSRESFLTLKRGGQAHRLSLSHILYCEIIGHNAHVHGTDREEIYRCTMKELEEQLLPHGFLRPHISYLVNANAIERVEPALVILRNGSEVPISKHRRKQFLADLAWNAGGWR